MTERQLRNLAEQITSLASRDGSVKKAIKQLSQRIANESSDEEQDVSVLLYWRMLNWL